MLCFTSVQIASGIILQQLLLVKPDIGFQKIANHCLSIRSIMPFATSLLIDQ
jgi:hypothetical protein